MLSLKEGEILIKTARAAIQSHLSGSQVQQVGDNESRLLEKSGVFITLLDHSKGNLLRGCIGLPYATEPLLHQVRIAAVEAASSDFRFEPLELAELDTIIVEATVLSPIEPIWVKNPLDLRENIVVGRDGLVVEGMGKHGLLLPQVAVDEGFDSEEFLSNCCLKADLPPDSWLTGSVRVSRFQGQVFAEEKPNGRVFDRSLSPRN